MLSSKQKRQYCLHARYDVAELMTEQHAASDPSDGMLQASAKEEIAQEAPAPPLMAPPLLPPPTKVPEPEEPSSSPPSRPPKAILELPVPILEDVMASSAAQSPGFPGCV